MAENPKKTDPLVDPDVKPEVPPVTPPVTTTPVTTPAPSPLENIIATLGVDIKTEIPDDAPAEVWKEHYENLKTATIETTKAANDYIRLQILRDIAVKNKALAKRHENSDIKDLLLVKETLGLSGTKDESTDEPNKPDDGWSAVPPVGSDPTTTPGKHEHELTGKQMGSNKYICAQCGVI